MTENVNAVKIDHISEDVKDIKTGIGELSKAMTELAVMSSKRTEQFNNVITNIDDLKTAQKETNKEVAKLKEKVHKNTIYNGIIKVAGASIITALSTTLVVTALPVAAETPPKIIIETK